MAISAKSKRYRSDAIGRTKKAVKHARYYWLMLAESHFMRRAFIMAVTVVGAAFAIQRAHGQPPPFTFSKVDLKLLEESEALDRQIEKRALVYHDAALEQNLADLAAPLLPAAPLDRVQWKFRILRDPLVDAFALANGSVYVTSGLLAITENGDQLAGVLAREIAHVANRHPYIMIRSARKKVVAIEVSEVIETLAYAGTVWRAPYAPTNMGGSATVPMVYGYSRKLEEEADHNAVDRVKATGRDPLQLVRMFAIMDGNPELEPVPVFNDPNTKARIAYLKKVLGVSTDAAPRIETAYVDRMRPVILQNLQLDLDSRRFRSAVAEADRLAAAHPDDPVVLYWLGEAYRSLGPRQMGLTAKGQRKEYGKAVRRTEEEDREVLAKTPAGAAALQGNQQRAEELFLKAAAIDPSLAEPYFGLGALYQQQARAQEAVAAYRKYITLCRQPADKERAERLIADIEDQFKAASKGGVK